VHRVAHARRLKVWPKVMGQGAGRTFASSKTSTNEAMFRRGDAQYHLGFSRDRKDARRTTKCTCRWRSIPAISRPSIRWSVGRVTRKAAPPARKQHQRVLECAWCTADAAFAGQGLVAETLNLSDITAIARAARASNRQQSERFTTLARLASTIKQRRRPDDPGARFPRNGEDPDAVAQVVRGRGSYARTFPATGHRTVLIRKYGHTKPTRPPSPAGRCIKRSSASRRCGRVCQRLVEKA